MNVVLLQSSIAPPGGHHQEYMVAALPFLFSGKSERLRLGELYNKPAKGGLGFLNIRLKVESLLLKQLTRMLLKDQE